MSSSSGSGGGRVGQEPLGARDFVAAERGLGQAQRDLGGAGIALDDFLEQRLRLVHPLARVELLGQRQQIGGDHLAGPDADRGRLEPRLEVGRIELRESDDEGVGAGLVAARLALVDRDLQVGLGLDQLPLLDAGLDQLQQRRFVLRIELEDLLVVAAALA